MTTSPIPLFPLSTVLFPDGYLPLQIFEVRYLDMIKRAIAAGTGFGIVTLTDGAEVRTPDAIETVAPVGTMVQIRSHAAPMPGLMQIQCIGTSRFRIDASERLKHGLWMGQVTPLPPDQVVSIPNELEDTADALGRLIRTLQDEQVVTEEMPLQAPFRLDECGWVANRWAELLPFEAEQKLRLLELDNPLVRLELIQDLLQVHGVL
ncbi:MAG: LON peptidase substrate-binding domain-containing protein [Herminiimonas sp.]|nr:LON peptidase substrate-binding domain-containing protein [Herminiimonas sp.]